ncbi:efflux RND transporter periplasmic adaptor subunit [Ferrimonas balearica]|uniref:efflux RND transporter periplasmic adaptor subunit n=1 Tax=Ferrimonas balearica TaxID=44012 RepID=UPI001C98A8DD|nr:efflux RND transporter periplasmic adaptor subunit [Ferrimonas balearica]MBY6223986.1 efflux RND transporter periplasmic adaptor subunit [Ferrimonas balearica]
MKIRTWLLLAVVALLLGAGWLFGRGGDTTAPAVEYRTETLSRGDINNTVSATGTLAAVDDVIVGAQLSGQITEVYVDFNDTVSAGQLLAQIDPRTFAARVAQSKALVAKTEGDIALQTIVVERARVNFDKAQRDMERAEGLVAANYISADEVDAVETALVQAELDLKQSEAQLAVLKATLAANRASLAQDQIELDRTEIRAPIDGFVIDRTIERGQTVASSLNTPELFTLAKDLSQMEIEAYIDESDIGQLREGQRVDFTVDAFPDQSYVGRVAQIRRAPQDTSGVISYTVIISAPNRSGTLLPGMTANLEIAIDAVRDVSRVSNGALRVASQLDKSQASAERGPLARLAPLGLTEQQQARLQAELPQSRDAMSSRSGQQMRQRMEKVLDEVLTDEQKALRAALKSGKVKLGTLYLLKEGKPEPVSVQLGISDGQYTEVIKPNLDGEAVVVQLRALRG